MQKSYYQHTPKIFGGIVLSAVLLIGVYTLVLTNENDTALSTELSVSSTTDQQPQTITESTAETEDSAKTQSDDSVQSATTIADGTYSTTINYSVPKGHTNTLSVEVTLKNGLIDAVSTTSEYEDHDSREYIDSFERSVESAVVDEGIDTIKIGRIGGASLTSDAFERALNSIIVKARS